MGLLQNAKKAGSSKTSENAQAYSPEGYSISLLPALNSRQDAAAFPVQGIKIAIKRDGLTVLDGGFEAP